MKTRLWLAVLGIVVAQQLGLSRALAATYTNTVNGYIDTWIPITLAVDTQYTITMTGTGTVNAANAGFYLYDANKAHSITSGYAYTTPTPYGPTALLAGSYWIQVWGNSAYATGSYTITTAETAAALTNDSTSNDSKASASTATLEAANTGHLGYANGYSSGNTHDYEDWWKIVLPSDGQLNIDFTTSGASSLFGAYTGYYLYSDNDKQMYSTTTLGTSTSPLSLKAGTYYMKLWINSTYQYGSYSFTPRFSAAVLTNDSEDNDTKATAKDASVGVKNTGHIGYDGNTHDWEDWWKITLPADDTLTIKFETSGTSSLFGAYSGYYLYNSSDVSQDSTNSLSSSYAGGPYNLKAGTYYLRFWVNGAYEYGSYAFTPTLKSSQTTTTTTTTTTSTTTSTTTTTTVPATTGTTTTSLMSLGAWNVYGTAALQGGTLTIGDNIGYDSSDTDSDGNPYNTWFAGSVSGQSGVDYDEAVSVQEFTPPLKLSWTGCFPETSQGYNNIMLGRKNSAFTGSANSQQYPITQEFGFSTRWDISGLNTTALVNGTADVQRVTGATASANGYCSDYRIEWADNLLKFYYNGMKVRELAYTYVAPITVVVRSFDKPHTLTAMSMESATQATTTNAKSDCLFNWAESTYGFLFSPKGSPSITFGPYYLRYYSGTSSYLAVASGSLVYLGPLSGNQLADLGAVSTWYANAGCK